MNRWIVALTLSVVLLVGLMKMPLTASAGIIPVPSPQHGTIQAALDSAFAGDTVLVASGTYYENLVWPNKQGIKMTSQTGPSSTIIDGGKGGSVITMAIGLDSTTLIDGFTIRNGLTQGPGGEIVIIGSSITIQNNVLTGNEAEVGGAISAAECSPIIRNNEITHNSCTFVAGGIDVFNNASPLIVGNLIAHNTAGFAGGGIKCFDHCAPTIRSNTIVHNTAQTFGGAIHCAEYCDPDIYGNTISDNVSLFSGGGITCFDRSSARIVDNILSHNVAASHAAAAKVCGHSNALMTGNCIFGNEGEGVYVCDASTVTLNYNNIVGNTGLGVRNTDLTVTIDAEYNWWGDPAGPTHPANPLGNGDAVSDGVDFSPWLNKAVPCIPEPSTFVTFTGLLGMGLIGYWRRSRKLSRR